MPPQPVQHLIPYLFEKYIESLTEKAPPGSDYLPPLVDMRKQTSKAKDFVLFAEKFFTEVHVTTVVNDGSGIGFGLTNGDTVTIDRPDPSAVPGAIDNSGYVPVTGS